jgi:hypothetical protein
MKRIATLLALVVLPVAGLLAQDFKELTPQERKELRKKEQQQLDSTSYANAVEALSAQTWVLEAYTIQGQRGNLYFVNSTTNFVMMDKDRATVQLASPYRAGYNGLGGITVEGSISGYKLETDKHGNVSVRFMVIGVGINAEIFITLDVNSNRGEAYISPNTWGRRITYRGNIVPLEDSSVYKAMPL